MLKLDVGRPKNADIKELNQFFRNVITDTFHNEGLGDKLEDIENEIKTKDTYLKNDLASNGAERYFLIGLVEGEIIGTIEYGPASDLICKITNNTLKDLPEIGTVFVKPELQKKGIGNSLLKKMYFTLRDKGIAEFCLDSGYSTSQKIWENKFGEPDYLLENYWGGCCHHMIWRREIDKLLK